ncbi:MAG: F0F1 ATP synthase subunit gamma [Rhodocyclaceae bacterium]|nr:F0F1 ATP synthase subunit gamma [Rhodocyclaceae bacterium]
MSRRRAVEARLALFDDLAGILGAMKSFALAELHRVLRREQAQHATLGMMERALAEVAEFLPLPPAPRRDTWLLLGSVRGFCGSFNDEVVGAWLDARQPGQPTLVVGERLAAAMPPGAWVALPGADGGLDAPAAIDRILAAFSAHAAPGEGLVACAHDERAPLVRRLLPLPGGGGRSGLAPLTNEAPPRVAAGVAQHYLFHALLALLLASIRTENRRRLLQMENALHHIERYRDDLTHLRNRLRQEEIVEEIEVMTGLRRATGGTPT